MNERINELLKQATTDALYETKDAIDFLDNPVSKQQRQLQLEKFAELIVRECVQVCEPILDEPYENMTEFSKGLVEGQDVAIERIKQHFGVE